MLFIDKRQLQACGQPVFLIKILGGKKASWSKGAAVSR
jgi:hypothetical protein